MKKLLLSLGIMTTTTLPLLSVISCGNNNTNNDKVEELPPVEIEETISITKQIKYYKKQVIITIKSNVSLPNNENDYELIDDNETSWLFSLNVINDKEVQLISKDLDLDNTTNNYYIKINGKDETQTLIKTMFNLELSVYEKEQQAKDYYTPKATKWLLATHQQNLISVNNVNVYSQTLTIYYRDQETQLLVKIDNVSFQELEKY